MHVHHRRGDFLPQGSVIKIFHHPDDRGRFFIDTAEPPRELRPDRVFKAEISDEGLINEYTAC